MRFGSAPGVTRSALRTERIITMLEAMRELALEFLRDRLGGRRDEDAADLYRRTREENPGALFPFLVEALSITHIASR